MDRIAHVFYNGYRAGTLTQTEERQYRFQYDSDYLAYGAPLAFRLPLQREEFRSDTLFPFFENLASEGWLKHIQSSQQKIDERDTFSLLIHNGDDLIGAVTLKEGI